LYKILIENAFNPQNRTGEEIEQYVESLVKAYDAELEAIKTRTRVNNSRAFFRIVIMLFS